MAFNSTGDWIALGCSGLGQLLVWEWQSETYVMKQQGHFNNMQCLAYSPDGHHLATGGDDGKVCCVFLSYNGNSLQKLRNLDFVAWEKQRCWPVCTSSQSDQHLCYSLFEKYNHKTSWFKHILFVYFVHRITYKDIQ